MRTHDGLHVSVTTHVPYDATLHDRAHALKVP